MTGRGGPRRFRAALRLGLLSGPFFVGSIGCDGAPTGDPVFSGTNDDGAAPMVIAEEGSLIVPDQVAPSTASLFEAGSDGLLRPRQVELPPLPTTRGRAEALVRRLVEESGTFPAEVRVLDVFVSGRGVAVINFTLDLVQDHSGGLLAEELTVYSLSHALVESFPAIAEVRLLVEGREADTLAGHLDLRSGFGRAPERLLADPGPNRL